MLQHSSSGDRQSIVSKERNTTAVLITAAWNDDPA